MADLNIIRYRFRLVRRGWTRGPDGLRVVAAAHRRLPSVVAERLAHVWSGDREDVSEPVRLRLRVWLADLVRACDSDEALAALVARLLPGAEDAQASVDVRRRETGPAPGSLRQGPSASSPGLMQETASILDVLLAWRARGDLDAQLKWFAEDTLEDWHGVLLRTRHQAGPGGAAARQDEVRAIVRALATLSGSRVDRLRRRIVAAVEVAAQVQVTPQAAGLPALLDDLLPLPGDDADAPGERSTRAQSAFRTTDSLAVPTRDTAPASHGSSGFRRQSLTFSIDCALPFLLLRPLERLGYVDLIETVFSAADRRDQLPAFAAALACKVLKPPERGWQRGASATAAAAFAGRIDPLLEAAVSVLAESAGALLSPLDGLLGRSVLAGHDAARPLLLVAAGDDRLLVDVDGLFPIAHATNLHTALTGCRSLVVVPIAAADASVFARLEAGAARFVTDAPPTRGERWRRLRGRRRLWSNDLQTADDVLARAAAALDVEEDAVRLVQQLAVRRASIFDRTGALDRSLAVAAGVGLAHLAWTLWRDREPTSPELALTRFGDFSAHVRFADDRVTVRLPLGARLRDLERHGFLGDFHVPWIDGRVVTLCGG